MESHTEATWVGETSTRSEQLNPSFGKAVRQALTAKDLGAGRADFTPEETKALIVGTDTAGGYLAPLEFVNQLIDVTGNRNPHGGVPHGSHVGGRNVHPVRTA